MPLLIITQSIEILFSLWLFVSLSHCCIHFFLLPPDSSFLVFTNIYLRNYYWWLQNLCINVFLLLFSVLKSWKLRMLESLLGHAPSNLREQDNFCIVTRSAHVRAILVHVHEPHMMTVWWGGKRLQGVCSSWLGTGIQHKTPLKSANQTAHCSGRPCPGGNLNQHTHIHKYTHTHIHK